MMRELSVENGRKTVITGIGGYIGSNLGKYLCERGYDVYGIYRSSPPVGVLPQDRLYQGDITSADQMGTVIDRILPDTVIHAAGWSSLDQCEKTKDLAVKINVDGTRNIVESIRRMNRDTKLVFISSDYVFGGDRGNYSEGDEIAPQTVYGNTKALAEAGLRGSLNNYVIARTAAVYGRGGRFFNFIVANLRDGKSVELYDDVLFTPTYIDYLLDSVERLIQNDFRGVVHVAGPDMVSRFSFGTMIAESLGKDKGLVKPVRQPPAGLICKDSSLNSQHCRTLLRNLCPSLEKCLHYCFGHLISPYFYFEDQRGTFTGVTHSRRWEEINHVESVKGSVRGNHYHKSTVEGFYILAGDIEVSLTDLRSGSRRRFRVGAGDFFVVEPETLHTFEVLEDARWMNMLSSTMSNRDQDIHRL